MNYVGKTEKGHIRPSNQDHYQIIKGEAFHLFIVADGMGGHQGGEIASSMACELLESLVDKNVIPEEKMIIDAINTVNKTIWEKSQRVAEVRGMGTTLALLCLTDEGDFFVNIGDSRIYGMKGGALRQLSEDDSYVNMLVQAGEITAEEARNHPQRSMITNAVGTGPSIKVEVNPIKEKFDQFLLCSDGLSSVVDHKDIQNIMNNNVVLDKKADELMYAALNQGGPDNVTVIVVEKQIEGDQDA